MVVRIGVAGWNYADWRGVVYPRGCKDELGWLARFVDCIEINVTFYRLPTPDVVASWVARTADRADFCFTAKLPRDLTHRAGALDLDVVRGLHASLEPLRASGRLRGLLAQFSHRFVADDAAFSQLASIAESFEGLAPLVAELRHGSWRDLDAWRRVRELGFTIARLDYPGSARGGFDGAAVPPSDELAYYRLHGRNSDAWFRKDAGRDEVYDYAYPPHEVDELVARTRELAALHAAADTLVVANNHFEGKAVTLALEMRASLVGRRVAVPDTLLAAYPQLARVARGVLF